jgi:methionyl aminopeptidase
MTIHIKTEKEIEIMRKAGKILAGVMAEIEKEIRPGVDTAQLDKLAEELILKSEGLPAFKGYGDKKNPFPATLCTSVNSEIVHGIPSQKVVLNEGDLLKVDIGMEYQGFFMDMARTFAIGKISSQASKIKEAAEKSFWKGIANLKEGAMLSDYSKAVEKYVEEKGFSIVRNLVGHGIGKNLHEPPQIPNFYEKGYRDLRITSGMTFAFEPMINEGTYQSKMGDDDWVFITADDKLSAHYENTVLITKRGVEVLTI